MTDLGWSRRWVSCHNRQRKERLKKVQVGSKYTESNSTMLLNEEMTGRTLNEEIRKLISLLSPMLKHLIQHYLQDTNKQVISYFWVHSSIEYSNAITWSIKSCILPSHMVCFASFWIIPFKPINALKKANVFFKTQLKTFHLYEVFF